MLSRWDSLPAWLRASSILLLGWGPLVAHWLR
jgi:hypothetical protein